MSYVNYSSQTMRATLVDGATSGQDTAITLPESVSEFWVVVTKTAEKNVDNLLTVRIQSQVGSTWFDLGWDSITTSVALTAGAEGASATNVTRTANILDGDDTVPTYSIIAHYKSVPARTIRSIFVSSGTPAGADYNTFGVVAYYMNNQF